MAETPVSPIAVIGMGCRLPGGIDSPAGLWAALLRGVNAVTTVPLDRWDAEEYFDPEPGVPGRSVSKWGAFIDDVAGFDADFFNISEREAIAIDPSSDSSWRPRGKPSSTQASTRPPSPTRSPASSSG